MTSDFDLVLDYVASVAEMFCDFADQCIEQADLENALEFVHLAAVVLVSQNRTLSSERIERTLQAVALRIPAHGAEDSSHRTRHHEHVLHVLDEALPAGGLTAMAMRWMEMDSSARQHSLALLDQRVPLHPTIASRVAALGGVLHSPPPNASLVAKATWLRRLSANGFSAIVLHVGNCNVVCGAAYGVDGGPPVFLVNHAAHNFWTGISTVDVVLNCRGSALEKQWTEQYRGATSSRTLPIPLLDPHVDPTVSEASRRRSKQSLGLPPDCVLIVSIGSSFKYTPANGLDFLDTFTSLLIEFPKVYMLVVGTEPGARWASAQARLDSRIQALGAVHRVRLEKILAAADLYVEGFPFGTTTSLLEAAIRGIPVVLPPPPCLPPYASDGLALDDVVVRAASVEEYVHDLRELCVKPDRRIAQGLQVRASVLRHHTGSTWSAYVAEALQHAPPEHKVHLPAPERYTPAAAYRYWSALMIELGTDYRTVFELSWYRSLVLGLSPRLDEDVLRRLRAFEGVRVGHTVPLSSMWLFEKVVAPMMPRLIRPHLFRLLCAAHRPRPMRRVRAKISSLIRRREQLAEAYSEYKKLASQGGGVDGRR